MENADGSLVIDDVLPPWQPSGVEIRGLAQPLPTGGNALFGANYPVDETIIRITPVQIIGWGLDPEAGWSLNRRGRRKRIRLCQKRKGRQKNPPPFSQTRPSKPQPPARERQSTTLHS